MREVRELIDDQVSDALLRLAAGLEQRAAKLCSNSERAQIYVSIGAELREEARRPYG